jgi:hypothetical protein
MLVGEGAETNSVPSGKNHCSVFGTIALRGHEEALLQADIRSTSFEKTIWQPDEADKIQLVGLGGGCHMVERSSHLSRAF